MKFAALVLLLLPLFAADPPPEVAIGKAVVVSGNRIQVATSAGMLTVFSDAGTKIWRGGWGQALSTVKPGDEVSIRYHRDSDGRLVVVDLYANIDRIWGRITKVRPNWFEVDQNFNADPRSAYRRGYRQIVYRSGTAFELSAPEDLRVGRTVDVIGLKIGASRVRATRITIYDGKTPMRMPRDARIQRPDGSVQDRK